MLIIPMFEEDTDDDVIVISTAKKEIEVKSKNWQVMLPELQLQLVEVEIDH